MPHSSQPRGSFRVLLASLRKQFLEVPDTALKASSGWSVGLISAPGDGGDAGFSRQLLNLQDALGPARTTTPETGPVPRRGTGP
jgi:hypothetical protein